jgi:hypothetical protein
MRSKMNTKMAPSNPVTTLKCPKCGATLKVRAAAVHCFEQFDCGSKYLNGVNTKQTDRCRIAELEKLVERLRKGFEEYGDHLPSCQLKVPGIYRGKGPRCTCGFTKRASVILEKKG